MFDLEPYFLVFEEHLSLHSETTEINLINALKAAELDPFSEFNLSHSQDLFRAHFLTKHLLYRLQDYYFEQGRYYLEITLTRIRRELTAYNESNALSEADHTKAYYLNIQHYFETEEDEVNDLLNSFWSRYLAADDKAEALATLGLSHEATYAEVKQKYRALAQKYHPDKPDGCAETFKRVSGAKRLLDAFYK